MDGERERKRKGGREGGSKEGSEDKGHSRMDNNLYQLRC